MPLGTWMLAGSPLDITCSVPFENDGSMALLKGLWLCFKLEATGGLEQRASKRITLIKGRRHLGGQDGDGG